MNREKHLNEQKTEHLNLEQIGMSNMMGWTTSGAIYNLISSAQASIQSSIELKSRRWWKAADSDSWYIKTCNPKYMKSWRREMHGYNTRSPWPQTGLAHSVNIMKWYLLQAKSIKWIYVSLPYDVHHWFLVMNIYIWYIEIILHIMY